jgi:preprotein translocase subunit SecA
VTDADAMRPGLVSGRYPERRDRDSGWGNRLLGALQGVPSPAKIVYRAGLRRIARAIDDRAGELSALDKEQLDGRRQALQRQFRIHGLSGPLSIQAFALIRELAGRTIHQRHYASQLMAGWVMLHGSLAEMETGEGKTLSATLAAAAAALAGIPVHVITVNEYLVARDAGAMGPLYRALGLTVGFVTGNMTAEERRAAYACDITYATNKQIAFDYLRDRLLLGSDRGRLRLNLESAIAHGGRMGQLLLRGLCFAIVDEADSVLIDEARTPLILTRSVDSTTAHTAYRQTLELARQLERDDFFIDPARPMVHLSLAGQQKLASMPLAGERPWQNARRREELVLKALHALHLLQRDRDYLVHGEKVSIIDANTGRIMPDRAWEQGLHQLVEAKEGLPLTEEREPLGRLTYQRFFRRYIRLGGMTGTAREVEAELWSVYGLRVRRIPLQRPSRRRELPARIYSNSEEKWAAVIRSVKEMQDQGRPVLIGTGSVAESEELGGRLTAVKIAHRLLNARQDKEEAKIVAAAGRRGHVTVATNMAGRGTDIPLAHGVAEMGGLHVIATCRNEARRIDRQLYGRCARQGDPGTHQAILSLEDAVVRQYCHPGLIRLLRLMAGGHGRIQGVIKAYAIRRAQRRAEGLHREARRSLLRHEREIGRILAFSGALE